MLILNPEQMREADRHAIEDVGIPSLVLMENAGGEVVRVIEESLDAPDDAAVLVLCGHGNNGGDGMVVSRKLAARGFDVATAKQVFGEVQSGVGKPPRTGHPVRMFENAVSALTNDIAEGPKALPELFHLANGEVVQRGVVGKALPPGRLQRGRKCSDIRPLDAFDRGRIERRAVLTGRVVSRHGI